MLGESGQDGVRGGRDHHGERRDKQPVEQSDGGVDVQIAAEGHLLFGGQEEGIRKTSHTMHEAQSGLNCEIVILD